MDAGCGTGDKSAWFASLAPHANIIAMDSSESINIAYKKFHRKFENITFVHGNIADTKIKKENIDFIFCDQVIMHTENPRQTLLELSKILKHKGLLLCYWYKKKALPRELIDEYFRLHKFSNKELIKLSKELVILGKLLQNLNINTVFPEIKSLGIKGGKMSLQTYIYNNFIKCFWNKDLGAQLSMITNYDWYAPRNAVRFSKKQIHTDLKYSKLKVDFFHEEDSCYSGRFIKF